MKVASSLAFYGTASIPRGYCSECETYAFIIEGKLRCCGERVTDEPTGKFKQESECAPFRKKPGIRVQRTILEQQRNLCFYCERKFGSKVYRKGRTIYLRVNWDHINPYVYSLNNRDQNFVAACHVCNGIKSSLMFRSLDEARTHIFGKWAEKNYSDLPPLRVSIQPETDIAKVL